MSYPWIQKKGDTSTRLNFSFSYLETKVIPEGNVSLNFTDGGTPIAIEQGAKIAVFSPRATRRYDQRQSGIFVE